MSKGGPIIALGVAAPCTVVGGFYLAKSTNIDATLPTSLTDFKGGNGGDCVQALFSGIKKLDGTGASVASSSGKVSESLFQGQSSSAEGCLVINGDKQTKDSKGKGNFRFLGAMKKGNKGFVTFTKGEAPGTEDKKIKWEGIAYTLKLETNKPWEIDKKKEVASNKEMDETAIKSKFPTTGEAISGMDQESAFGFMKPSTDVGTMCGKSDCTGGTTTTTNFKGYWKGINGTGNNDKTADNGSKNLGDWGDDLYTKGDWDMQDVVKNVKGSGIKVLVESKPTTKSTVAK